MAGQKKNFFDSPVSRFWGTVVVLILLILILAAVIFATNYWKHWSSKPVFDNTPVGLTVNLPKPADFYYVTKQLPTSTIPSQFPSGIVLDKNAKMQSISVMTAAGKPTIYTLQYLSALPGIQIVEDYASYFQKNNLTEYDNAQGQPDYVSSNPAVSRIQLNVSLDPTTGYYIVKINFIQYDANQ
jgi:hypothetical protein